VSGNTKTGITQRFRAVVSEWLLPFEEIDKQERSKIYEELEADVITVEKREEDHK
jgi:hypothetical protein